MAHTLLVLDQSGDYMSGPFTAEGPWTIAWSYDCSKITSGHDWLIVGIYRDAGGGTANLFDTITPPPGDALKGSTPETQGGTFYLKVTSECAWHMTAMG